MKLTRRQLPTQKRSVCAIVENNPSTLYKVHGILLKFHAEYVEIDTNKKGKMAHLYAPIHVLTKQLAEEIAAELNKVDHFKLIAHLSELKDVHATNVDGLLKIHSIDVTMERLYDSGKGDL